MLHVLSDTVSLPGADPAAFIVSAPVILAITGLVIPLLTGLLTKLTLASWIKGVLMIFLNAIAAAVVTATRSDGTAVFSVEMLMSTIYGAVISSVIYLNVYRHAGLTSSHPAGKLAPSSGIGPKVEDTPPHA
jgi:small basic protein